MDGLYWFAAEQECKVRPSEVPGLFLGGVWCDRSAHGQLRYLPKNGRDNYVVPFKYKRTIGPGGNDRFTLQIASEVSTYQNFRIRLTTAEGREIISPRCRMHFLVPRNHSWKEGHVIEDP
jgi:hypothetical protein